MSVCLYTCERQIVIERELKIETYEERERAWGTAAPVSGGASRSAGMLQGVCFVVILLFF